MPATVTVAKAEDYVIAKITTQPGKRRARLYAKAGKPVPPGRFAVKLMTKEDFAALQEAVKPRPDPEDEEED